MASCDTCGGSGEYRDGDGITQVCGTCGGSGSA